MLPSTFVMADLQTITPELFMCGAAFALLMLDLFDTCSRRCRGVDRQGYGNHPDFCFQPDVCT